MRTSRKLLRFNKGPGSFAAAKNERVHRRLERAKKRRRKTLKVAFPIGTPPCGERRTDCFFRRGVD